MRNLLNSYIGDYRLTGFLGAGGMGEVYLAVHHKIGRVAAIKLLTCFDPHSQSMRRFINEARIQASLQHPNIATLYDYIEFEGRPCIIMEFVDGQTLYERIQTHGPLPLAETLAVFQAVVGAISYMHEKGILHRDIKSNNIKLTSSGEAKLLDFGIARDPLTPGLTRDGHYVGTLYYLSPEQIMGKKADPRSDVWALGILLYEMVTGGLPFESESISELYQKIRRADYVHVSRLDLDIPETVEKIITRCLQQKPAERFSSAAELSDAIRNIPHESRIAPAQHQKHGRSKNACAFLKDYRPLLLTGLLLLIVLIAGAYLLRGNPGKNVSKTTPAPEYRHSAPAEPASSSQSLTQVKIDTYDGRAEVYENNRHAGRTPYIQNYPVGSRVKLTLKREGYQDKVIQFEVGEISNQYSYGLDKRHP